MARRVVSGGFRATCVLASAVSSVATRSFSKFVSTLNPASAPDAAPASWQRPMEPLEARQLLAGVTSVTFSAGILKLVAPNNQGNTINVTTSGSNITGKVNSTAKTVPISQINEIQVFGGNWNDTVRIDSKITKKTYVDGNAGNEKLYGGGGPDRL